MTAKNGKHPAAVTSAIQLLIKLADSHGIEVVNTVYAEAVAEHMACKERDVWRVRVADGQREMALIEGY